MTSQISQSESIQYLYCIYTFSQQTGHCKSMLICRLQKQADRKQQPMFSPGIYIYVWHMSKHVLKNKYCLVKD